MNNPPDWLPDWRNSGQYPDHGKNMNAWAWEFLRRNPEYWKDWELYKSNQGKYCFNRDLCDLRKGGVWREGDTLAQPLPVALAEKWGLMITIADPAANRPLIAFETFPSVFELSYHEVDGGPAGATGGPESWKQHGIIFDLEVQDFGPQLRFTKWSLEQQRNYLEKTGKIEPCGSKPERKNFPLYLRYLDARLCGASYGEISAVLVPDKDESPSFDTVKRNYKRAAEKLVNDEAYRWLPAKSSPPS